MTYAQLTAKMHEHHPILQGGNLGLILGNLILGLATLDTLNMVVAFTGIFVTLAANVHRIVYSVLWVVAIKRNGWRLTPSDPPPPAPKEPDNSKTDTRA